MEQSTGRRKLAAILMADVVERHMGEDEEATSRALTAPKELFSSTESPQGFLQA